MSAPASRPLPAQLFVPLFPSCTAISIAPILQLCLGGPAPRPPSSYLSDLLFVRRCSYALNRIGRVALLSLLLRFFHLVTNDALSTLFCLLFVFSLTAPSWQTATRPDCLSSIDYRPLHFPSETARPRVQGPGVLRPRLVDRVACEPPKHNYPDTHRYTRRFEHKHPRQWIHTRTFTAMLLRKGQY